MKKRHRDILSILRQLGGTATVRQIAERLDLDVNGVSQSMNALPVRWVEGKGGDASYQLTEPPPDQLSLLK